jgi:uncharacterized membrane protein
MYLVLKHLHSVNRWLVLLFLLWSLFAMFQQLQKGSHKLLLQQKLTFILSHTQLLLGIILYFLSPKVVFSADSMSERFTRFYLVEHTLMMLIAIALITIGYIRFKKSTSAKNPVKSIFWFYLAALMLMLAAIPWPSMNLGGSWY